MQAVKTIKIEGSGSGMDRMERVKGIEPSYSAWKAAALPLSYTRLMEVLMPALASSGKMECCFSELVCRLDPKVVDGRNKSGHDSVGGRFG